MGEDFGIEASEEDRGAERWLKMPWKRIRIRGHEERVRGPSSRSA